jgi:hypothetical protein
MKLLTKEIITKLEKSPLGSQDGNPNAPIIVKFFAPWTNWTWFVTEGEKNPETGDWEFFGMVHGHEKELGYFTLSELESVTGPMGLKIERDMYYSNNTLANVR